MNAESDNFRELRRLLALKRYEQPPPGYFNNFSRQVMARIEAGERGSGPAWSEGWVSSSSWLARLWNSFGAKPILAGAFGVAVCSVLISGVAYSDRGDAGNLPAVSTPTREQAGLSPMGTVVAGGLSQPVSTPGFSGTGAVVPGEERTSLFQEVQRPRPQLIDVVAPAAMGN
jgi:hypothetical protein